MYKAKEDALFPIGVNVVNPVSLPILRSPGAQLKDALLPQAMVGLTGYLDGGVTAEVYYQLEQKELELDASGSFFGSDLVGVGNQQGIISSALYNEDTSLPAGMGYHDVATCMTIFRPADLVLMYIADYGVLTKMLIVLCTTYLMNTLVQVMQRRSFHY